MGRGVSRSLAHSGRDCGSDALRAERCGGLKGYTFANLVQAPADPSVRWVVARESHLRGPWGYCDQLRSLVGDAAPVAVFRGENPRHTVKVMVFDRMRSGSPPAVASPPLKAIRQ